MFETIRQQAHDAVCELLEIAKLQKGDVLVVGCSSSEVGGSKIGTDSSPEVAKAIFGGIYPVLKEKGIYLAAQCCEHLNLSLIHILSIHPAASCVRGKRKNVHLRITQRRRGGKPSACGMRSSAY